MRKNSESYLNLSHLNLKNIIERGTPELKIFIIGGFLALIGISFSFLKILAVVGFMILGFMLVPSLIWIYLKLK